MEKETGAKISIRGKGSHKNGRQNDKKQPGDDEELHVHISADTDEAVEAASKMVEELLNPSEENDLRKVCAIYFGI